MPENFIPPSIAVLLESPPFQRFSFANPGGKDDKKNFWTIGEALRKINPAFVVCVY